MAITYEQFKIVLGDDEARKQIGLDLNDSEAGLLQHNEARAIAFFEKWNQSGAVVTAPARVQLVAAAGLPWSGPAITGFVLAIVAGLSPLARESGATFIVGFVALILSATSITATRDGAKRGHGLAIAGTIISVLAMLGVVASALITSFHL